MKKQFNSRSVIKIKSRIKVKEHAIEAKSNRLTSTEGMNVNRDLATLPISPSTLTSLTRVGLMTIDDVSSLTSLDLSREACISEEQSSEVFQKISDSSIPVLRSSTAWEILQKEKGSPSIVTFSESLDDMLDGGVPLSRITEFCGAPGTGKTHICMQLSVDVQIPTDLGGLDGEVIYIDFEGSFVIDRVIDIAHAAIAHCQAVVKEIKQGTSTNEFTLNKILSSINYYRCQDHYELTAVLHQIPEIIRTHPKVKLLIVDNITSPVRQGFDDLLAQNQFLSSMGQSLIKIAKQSEIAVVLTNQMTTKIDFFSNKSYLAPALGETWSHIPNIRVIFQWEENQRRALLSKSPNKKEMTCSFQITANGIRDVENSKLEIEGPSQSSGKKDFSDTSMQGDVRDGENVGQCENPAKRARVS